MCTHYFAEPPAGQAIICGVLGEEKVLHGPASGATQDHIVAWHPNASQVLCAALLQMQDLGSLQHSRNMAQTRAVELVEIEARLLSCYVYLECSL